MTPVDKISEYIQNCKNPDKMIRRRCAEELGEQKAEKAITPLALLLLDPEPSVREAAGDALIRIGTKGAIEVVLPYLREENEPARNLACEILEAIGKVSLNLILPLLDDADGDVRKFIADILGNIGDECAVKPLMKKMDDKNPNVVTSVIESLGKLKDEKAVPCLLESLRGNFPFESSVALGLIESSQAIDGLLRVAGDRNNLARFASIEALGKIKQPVVIPSLLSLLDEKNLILHKTVLKALGTINEYWLEEKIHDTQDQWVKECFSEGINDSDPDLRRYSVIALGSLKDEQSTHQLIQLLKTDDEDLIPFVVHGLVKIGTKEPSFLLDSPHEDDNIQKHLAVVLGDIQNTSVLPTLIKMAKDENFAVRLASIRALGKYSDPVISPLLIETLRDEEELVRKAAADTLGWINAEGAIEPLFGLLEDVSKEVGESAISSLVMIGGERATTLLKGALSSEIRQVRIFASYGLGILGGESSIDVFKTALTDEDGEVRKTAIESLGRMKGNAEAIDYIKGAMRDDDPQVRIASLIALTNTAKESAIDTLSQGLLDPDPWVQFRAVKCLSSLNDPHIKNILEEKGHEAGGLVREAITEALSKKDA